METSTCSVHSQIKPWHSRPSIQNLKLSQTWQEKPSTGCGRVKEVVRGKVVVGGGGMREGHIGTST